jgi:hypothetical protein
MNILHGAVYMMYVRCVVVKCVILLQYEDYVQRSKNEHLPFFTYTLGEEINGFIKGI